MLRARCGAELQLWPAVAVWLAAAWLAAAWLAGEWKETSVMASGAAGAAGAAAFSLPAALVVMTLVLVLVGAGTAFPDAFADAFAAVTMVFVTFPGGVSPIGRATCWSAVELVAAVVVVHVLLVAAPVPAPVELGADNWAELAAGRLRADVTEQE